MKFKMVHNFVYLTNMYNTEETDSTTGSETI